MNRRFDTFEKWKTAITGDYKAITSLPNTEALQIALLLAIDDEDTQYIGVDNRSYGQAFNEKEQHGRLVCIVFKGNTSVKSGEQLYLAICQLALQIIVASSREWRQRDTSYYIISLRFPFAPQN